MRYHRAAAIHSHDRDQSIIQEPEQNFLLSTKSESYSLQYFKYSNFMRFLGYARLTPRSRDHITSSHTHLPQPFSMSTSLFPSLRSLSVSPSIYSLAPSLSAGRPLVLIARHRHIHTQSSLNRPLRLYDCCTLKIKSFLMHDASLGSTVPS
ncbi:hypothetical protein EI94DRAFT_946732 [Lactarius quietus]|nr:hypothetical protein EI94DRAFT_946732 [Lactarius quietus]